MADLVTQGNMGVHQYPALYKLSTQ